MNAGESTSVARVAPSGLVTPTAEGAATLALALGGKSVELPITVSGLDSPPFVDYANDVSPVLSRLGLGPRDRAVILHADDVGMCAATVTAFAELAVGGGVSSGSLMVPCPAFAEAAEKVRICSTCGNVDTSDPCMLCTDPRRDAATIIVVEDVADLWALERAGAMNARYHVLGGTLSALDAIGPEELGIDRLVGRIEALGTTEIILALGATVDGQTTAHYLAERLRPLGRRVTRLGHGVPVGGELNYLDEGTLAAALRSRQPVA